MQVRRLDLKKFLYFVAYTVYRHTHTHTFIKLSLCMCTNGHYTDTFGFSLIGFTYKKENLFPNSKGSNVKNQHSGMTSNDLSYFSNTVKIVFQ